MTALLGNKQSRGIVLQRSGQLSVVVINQVSVQPGVFAIPDQET
jgi:hypothetical protein